MRSFQFINSFGTSSILSVVKHEFNRWSRFRLNKQEGASEMFVHRGGPADQLQSFDVYRMKYRCSKLQVSLSSSNQSSDLEVFVFKRPRAPKQMIWHSLMSLYFLLGMRSYCGVASKWAWNFMDRWAPKLISIFGHEHFARGTSGSDDNSKKRAMEQQWRCLPGSSVSTVGLLFCCCL